MVLVQTVMRTEEYSGSMGLGVQTEEKAAFAVSTQMKEQMRCLKSDVKVNNLGAVETPLRLGRTGRNGSFWSDAMSHFEIPGGKRISRYFPARSHFLRPKF